MGAKVDSTRGFVSDAPVQVIEGRYYFDVFRSYDVAPDGQRFLMFSTPGGQDIAEGEESSVVDQLLRGVEGEGGELTSTVPKLCPYHPYLYVINRTGPGRNPALMR